MRGLRRLVPIARVLAPGGKAPGDEARTLDQLKAHYLIERELADRLRVAGREERRALYASVYDELFQRVPFHPQLTRKADPDQTAADIEPQVRLISAFLREGMTFLEVGSGDCAVSVAVARLAGSVYAVDVSPEIVSGVQLPGNVHVCLSDGTSIPVPEGTVDLAYSNQLIEHLHPDDAIEHARNIHCALAAGGRYLCITPNRLTGPHDVSKYFDDVARGFHLKEYTIAELRHLFSDVGFRRVAVLIGGRNRFVKTSATAAAWLEQLLGLLPLRTRRRIASSLHANAVLGIRIVAQK